MTSNIGEKIKEIRLSRKMTLKELSELTDLSIGFLSQVERGLTALAITSLEKIAKALGVELSYFFPITEKSGRIVVRSYERELFQIENDTFLHYGVSNDLEDKKMFPRIIEILPCINDEDMTECRHEGEEFIYVIEGVLAVNINGERYDLYPGDTAHFDSDKVHNWANFTNKVVKVLLINTPNSFRKIRNRKETACEK